MRASLARPLSVLYPSSDHVDVEEEVWDERSYEHDGLYASDRLLVFAGILDEFLEGILDELDEFFTGFLAVFLTVIEVGG